VLDLLAPTDRERPRTNATDCHHEHDYLESQNITPRPQFSLRTITTAMTRVYHGLQIAILLTDNQQSHTFNILPKRAALLFSSGTACLAHHVAHVHTARRSQSTKSGPIVTIMNDIDEFELSRMTKITCFWSWSRS
jgi:hypothetical protein